MKPIPIEMDEQDEHGVMIEIIRVLYNDRKVDMLPGQLQLPMHCILEDYCKYDSTTDTFKEIENE